MAICLYHDIQYTNLGNTTQPQQFCNRVAGTPGVPGNRGSKNPQFQERPPSRQIVIRPVAPNHQEVGDYNCAHLPTADCQPATNSRQPTPTIVRKTHRISCMPTADRRRRPRWPTPPANRSRHKSADHRRRRPTSNGRPRTADGRHSKSTAHTHWQEALK